MAYPHGIARPSEQLWAGEATTTSIPPDQRRRRISPMTNDTTKAAPDERAVLKPCPFCSDPMVPANECMGFTHNLRRKASRDCVISWAVIRPAHYAEWNTRTQPQVKALVWADTDDYGQKSDDYPWCECQTIIGDYAVGKHPDASFWAWYDPEDGPIGDGHACLSAAKAAAQADYTRRILEALA